MNDEKTVEALSIALRLVNPLTQNGNKKNNAEKLKTFLQSFITVQKYS